MIVDAVNRVLESKALQQKESRYVLVGPVPPPLGGVSMFMYRFGKLLKKNGFRVISLDFHKVSRINRFLRCFYLTLDCRVKVIHLNEFNFSAIIAMIARPYKSCMVFTDHSGRALLDMGRAKKRVLSLFLRRVDVHVIVHDHLRWYYRKCSLRLYRKKLLTHHAFLPPPPEDGPRITAGYSNELLDFVAMRSPLVLANAFRIVFYNNVDLYGLDMCLDLVASLKKKWPNIGLLFALADIGDKEYYKKIRREIEKLDLESNFMFMTEQRELWPLYKRADVFVRPTYVDGEAVSIREALFFGASVVASDACCRPSGVVYFSNRDRADLNRTVSEILDAKVCFQTRRDR